MIYNNETNIDHITIMCNDGMMYTYCLDEAWLHNGEYVKWLYDTVRQRFYISEKSYFPFSYIKQIVVRSYTTLNDSGIDFVREDTFINNETN